MASSSTTENGVPEQDRVRCYWKGTHAQKRTREHEECDSKSNEISFRVVRMVTPGNGNNILLIKERNKGTASEVSQGGRTEGVH